MVVFRLVREILFLCLVISLLLFNEIILYGLQQGAGQFRILYKAVPLEEVMQDPAYPDSVKFKISLVEEIKKFAVDSLGLNNSDNYTSYFDQQGKPVLWVITASEPFELKAKEWWFPVIGSVSYKGFFQRSRAEEIKKELILSGYDVDMGSVSAWSTLGFFNDPILSSMLNKTPGELANLIIHELTHGTIYAKSSVDFNENLASFIGDKGAIRFLKYKYGEDSNELKEYMEEDTDDRIYNDYMLCCIDTLNRFYVSLQHEKNEKVKIQKKDSVFRSIISGVNELPLSDKDFYCRVSSRALISKNAFFLNFEMYDSKQDEFEKEFETQFNSNLKAYLNYLKKIYGA